MFFVGCYTLFPLILFACLQQTVFAEDGDIFDLLASSIKKGAAIGDSYAAGLGVGWELDYSCSRYDGSYANIVGKLLAKADFTYSACSGAVVAGVNKQARELSSDQDFIIISAGGNDAELSAILDTCVYRFWGHLQDGSIPFTDPHDCNEKLDEVRSFLESGSLDEKVDGLIETALGKLSDSGNIFYVGYAKFFDTTDAACDEVSWHFWDIAGVEAPLTQDRRQDMNDLVDSVNTALRNAVERAGPKVHFVDYDEYVDMTNGRFCIPGADESSGNSANRDDLFFYEGLTEGGFENPDDVDDVFRRQVESLEDIQPANGTVEALYGAWVQETIEESDTRLSVNADNVDQETIRWVQKIQDAKAHFGAGSKVIVTTAEKDIVDEENRKMNRLIPDVYARIFHPTAGGHILIANLIIYTMEAVYVGESFPPEIVDDMGVDLPYVDHPACSTDASATWADRDTMIANINTFCADPENLHGSKGDLTSNTFNSNSLNYLNISISWDTDGAIGEHSCRAWLDAVTDGCDVPDEDGSNSANLKHGGTAAYESEDGNAVLKIEPLVVRRIWSGGYTNKCNVTDTWDQIDDRVAHKTQVRAFCEENASKNMQGRYSGIAESGEEFTRKLDASPYNGAFEVKVTWPRGPRNYQIFEDECNYFLAKLFNNCEDPEGDSWSVQTSGSIEAMSGVTYTVSFLEKESPDHSIDDPVQQTNRLISNGTDTSAHGMWNRTSVKGVNHRKRR